MELRATFRACRLIPLPPSEDGPGGAWVPPVDVYEADGALIVELELPGVSPRDIEVVCHGHVLEVCGAKPATAAAARLAVERFLVVERAAGSFRRQLRLPWPADPGLVTARLRDGLLVVRIPRRDTGP